MPKRSLGSAKLRWPTRSAVDAAFRIWCRAVASAHPEVVRIGYFGSYARGDWGVGSDLDIIVVVEQSNQPFMQRLLDVTDSQLPVPADILVYTQAEIAAMRAEGRRMIREIDSTAVWGWQRDEVSPR